MVADRIKLKELVLRGAGRTYDSIPSPYKFEDMSFSRLNPYIINAWDYLSTTVILNLGVSLMIMVN